MLYFDCHFENASVELNFLQHLNSMLDLKISKKSAADFLLVIDFRINVSNYTSIVASRQAKKEKDEQRKKELTVGRGYEEIGKEHNVISTFYLLYRSRFVIFQN